MGSGRRTGRPGWELAGNAVGSAGLSVVDPITGAMNASKALITNPISRKALQKSPALSKALEKTDRKFFADPLQDAHDLGARGRRPSGVQNAVSIYGLNALTGQVANTANIAGNVRYTFDKVKPIRQPFARQPQTKIRPLQSAFRSASPTPATSTVPAPQPQAPATPTVIGKDKTYFPPNSVIRYATF